MIKNTHRRLLRYKRDTMLESMRLTDRQIKAFQRRVLGFYGKRGRDLPWRKGITPYRIVVSEFMLQQTQVGRVMDRYPRFLARFPDWQTLAKASPREVLSVWQGLGYNRRALHLQRTARKVVGKYGGRLPRNPDELSELPGIGKATAGAILAYAYNLPIPFIETNVRRTFIDAFFKNKKTVSDRDILPLVDLTLDRKSPRRWYSALMDYGSMLGAKKENPNRRSTRYAKQTRFEGSRRQIRGRIVKTLLAAPRTAGELSRIVGEPEVELAPILSGLIREGFIRQRGERYRI